MRFQQIRGATAIVTFAEKRFLIGPFLADKGTVPPIPSLYNNKSNPLVSLPIPKEEIVNVNTVIVTHMHHFDDIAKNTIPDEMIMFTQNEQEAQDMRDLGFSNVTALQADGISFKGITLYRTDAIHGEGELAAKNYEAFALPAQACGVVFQAPEEKTLYMAGDTVWNNIVKAAIIKYQPNIIALNAALAQFADGTPIFMGTEGLFAVSQIASNATIIATHLDAVNHARISRNDMRAFVKVKGIETRVLIPEDGETIGF